MINHSVLVCVSGKFLNQYNFKLLAVKHLMTAGLEGNSEACFPKTLNVSRGEADIPPHSKLENYCEERRNRLLYASWLIIKFTVILRSRTWSRASLKFILLFPRELVSFVRPRELLSFLSRHVTDFPPIEKRIWVGRYNNKYWHIHRLAPREKVSFLSK